MGLLDLLYQKMSQEKAQTPPVAGAMSSVGVRDIPIFLGLEGPQQMDFLKMYGVAVWVYICVYEIALSASSIEFKLFQGKGKKKLGESSNGKPAKQDPSKMEELFDHPLMQLLDKPNPWMSGSDFINATFTYLELRGNCYYLLVNKPGKIFVGSPPLELYILNPDRVGIIPHKDKYIQGYRYEVDGQYIRYEPEDVIHLKYFNPTNEYYGQSPLEALQDTIFSERNAIIYNSAFYKNSSMPPGVLKADKALDDKAYRRLKREWQQAMAGAHNKHKTAILPEGLDYKVISINQKDAEFINSRMMNRAEVMAAYGVPPVIAGLETLSYATAQIQQQVYWSKTILPKFKYLLKRLNAQLLPLYDENLLLQGAFEDIPALQLDEGIKTQKAVASFQSGLASQNEARELMGFDSLGSAGDKFYLPMNLVPQDELLNPTPPVTPAVLPAEQAPPTNGQQDVGKDWRLLGVGDLAEGEREE